MKLYKNNKQLHIRCTILNIHDTTSQMTKLLLFNPATGSFSFISLHLTSHKEAAYETPCILWNLMVWVLQALTTDLCLDADKFSPQPPISFLHS
jgi:hypothetical protein